MTDKTEYDWDKIDHYLATEVMGWNSVEKYLYTDGYTGEEITSIFYEESIYSEYDWRPDEDLSQAVRCAEEMHFFELSYRSDNWYRAVVREEKGSIAIRNDNENPAKALCLAVLRASGADMSRFKMDPSK